MNKYTFAAILLLSTLANANGNLVCAQGDRPQSYYDQNNKLAPKTATFDVDMAASNKINVTIRLNSDDPEKNISSSEIAALTESYHLMLACGIWLGTYKYRDEKLEITRESNQVKAIFTKAKEPSVYYTCDQN